MQDEGGGRCDRFAVRKCILCSCNVPVLAWIDARQKHRAHVRKSAYAHVRRRSARTTKAIQMCLTHPFSNCGTPGVRTSAIFAGGGGIRALFGKGEGVCLSVPKDGTGTLQRTVLQPAGDRSAPEIARTTLPAPTLHETAPLPAGIGLGMTEARRHGRRMGRAKNGRCNGRW